MKIIIFVGIVLFCICFFIFRLTYENSLAIYCSKTFTKILNAIDDVYFYIKDGESIKLNEVFFKLTRPKLFAHLRIKKTTYPSEKEIKKCIQLLEKYKIKVYKSSPNIHLWPANAEYIISVINAYEDFFKDFLKTRDSSNIDISNSIQKKIMNMEKYSYSRGQ